MTAPLVGSSATHVGSRGRRVHHLNRCALALAAAVLLAGCVEPARGATGSGPLQAQWVDLPDGRVVACVLSDPDRWPASGVDCDWANAAREGEG